MKVLTLRAAKQDAEGALIVQRYATFEILTVGGQSGVDRVPGVVNGDGVEENPITANIAGLAKVGAPDGDYDVLKTNPDGSTERETLTWFDEKAARDVVVVARDQVLEAQSDVADMAAQVQANADLSVETLQQIGEIVAAGGIAYATRAELFADLAHGPNTLGYVYNDPHVDSSGMPDYVGIYYKLGAPGAGSWTMGVDRIAAEAVARTAGDQALANQIAPVKKRIKALPPNPYGYIFARVDANGYVGSGSKADAIPIAPPTAIVTALQATVTPLAARSKKLPPNPFGYVWARTDAAGYVQSAALADGTEVGQQTGNDDNAVTEPLAYAVSGVLHIVDSYGDHVISTDFAVFAPVVKGGVVHFLSDMFGGALRKFRMLSDGTCVAVEPDGVLDHILGYGQSNDVGAFASPLATTVNPYPTYSRMFNGGITPSDRATFSAVLDTANTQSLVPLAETIVVAGGGTTHGETKASGLCRSVQKRVLDALGTYQQLMYSSSGISGQSYAGLKKTTQPYANMMTCVAQARAIALAHNQLHIVRSIHVTHGEADQVSSTYATDLATWQANINSDVQAITGQSLPVHMFIDQYSAWNYVGNTANLEANGLKSPFAQDAAAAASAYIHLVCPKYIFDYPDTTKLHLSAASQRLLGAYHAKARKKVLMDRQKWVPLRPTAITRAGAVIDVQFAVPVGALAFDTSLVSDPGNYGFGYFDAGSPPAIVGVVLKPGTTDSVRITLASDPGASSGKRLRYAFSSTPNAGGGRLTGPRGCLRDSDPATADWDGTHLYNYCIHFDIACP